MKFIDLFAGIGGFRRGMELAGHECVGFCEWDKYAAASYISMHLTTEEQRKYLATLNLKKRQKVILKDEYRNGEWYSDDIRNVDAGSVPKCDCWCFGAPCQDFSIAGKRAGLDGYRSSLVREVFRILGEIREEDRPEWLIYENVKGMLSSNKGFDFLEILLAMDELGYDVEWQIFNSKDWGVPQNRERVYTVGHLRRCGTRKILPLTGADGENSIQQLGNYLPTKTRDNPNQGRIYSADGIAPCLNRMDGGGREPSVAVPISEDILLPGKNYNQRKIVHPADGISRTLISNGHSGNEPKIAIPVTLGANIVKNEIETAHCLNANDSRKFLGKKQDGNAVIIPVLTPDRVNKRQNGRHFKENGEPMFTLTGQDRHGVGTYPLGGIHTNASPDHQRGILDNCCRSLKANKSDAGIALKVKEATKQGYTIALEGDSINLDHPGSATRRGRVGKQITNTLATSCDQGIFVQVSDELTVYAIWYEKYQCYIAIRRLTPKECFLLQGWEDIYFERAAFVNSDSQLYKQAGNGVTVNVVYAIGRAIAELEESIV